MLGRGRVRPRPSGAAASRRAGRVRAGARARCVPCAGCSAGSARSPKTAWIALRSALAPSITNRIPCVGSRPRSTRSLKSAVATVAFSVLPSQSPSGILTPSVVIPSATMLVRPLRSIPSSIITASRTSSRRRAISSPSDSRVRSTNARDTDDLLVDPARLLDRGADRLQHPHVAARRDAGEHPLEHQPGQRVTVGEVRVGLPARPPAPRRRSAPAAARHRRGGRRGSPRRPRAHAAPHSEQDRVGPSGRQPHRPPPPSARPTRPGRHPRSTRAALPSQHPRARRAPPAHRTGNTLSEAVATCATVTVSFTAVPPSIFGGSPRTLPTGADEAEGPPSSSTSYGTT